MAIVDNVIGINNTIINHILRLPVSLEYDRQNIPESVF